MSSQLPSVQKLTHSLLYLIVTIHLINAVHLAARLAQEGNNETCGRAAYPGWFGKNKKLMKMMGFRMVGGTISPPNAWPWTAQLMLTSGSHCCGAALVATNAVVTAAHCFRKSQDPKDYKVLLGGFRFKDGEVHSVVNISVHPLFNIAQLSHDLAVLRFEPPAILSETIRTICLPEAPVLVNKKCIVTGWGVEREHGKGSPVLKEIVVPIFSNHLCNDRLHYNGLIRQDSMFCAGYDKGGVDACQGDSGGPLFCLMNNVWELHGLVSWGYGCGRPKKIGVYTKVFKFVSWIREELNEFSSS